MFNSSSSFFSRCVTAVWPTLNVLASDSTHWVGTKLQLELQWPQLTLSSFEKEVLPGRCPSRNCGSEVTFTHTMSLTVHALPAKGSYALDSLSDSDTPLPPLTGMVCQF